MSLRLGELCAGYGGLGLAVEEVFNAETAWFSEFDDAPSKILAHHWPDVPNYGDMTKIDWAAIEPVDIISGGTPCQDLSAAGRRAGMNEGTRSNLWVQMREAIAIQQPRYVVWENVRGAYSAEASSDLEQCPGCVGDTSDGRVFLRALGRVLGDLSDLGYDCQWRGLRASDVGACHGRFRVFVLAHDTRGKGGREGHLPTGVSTKGPHRPSMAHQPDKGRVRPELQDAAHAYRLGYERGWEARGRRARLTDGDFAAANTQGRGRGLRVANDQWATSGEINAPRDDRTATGGASGAPTNWGEYEPAIRRWEARLGRPSPRPTEPTGRGGGHQLSPRFEEWMMGLPDGWVTDPAIGISRNEQIKACGNGVVPQQAAAALRDMLAAFDQQVAE